MGKDRLDVGDTRVPSRERSNVGVGDTVVPVGRNGGVVRTGGRGTVKKGERRILEVRPRVMGEDQGFRSVTRTGESRRGILRRSTIWSSFVRGPVLSG